MHSDSPSKINLKFTNCNTTQPVNTHDCIWLPFILVTIKDETCSLAKQVFKQAHWRTRLQEQRTIGLQSQMAKIISI